MNTEFKKSPVKSQESSVTCSPQSGFITLISVLVAGAVSVSIAISLIILGLDASRASFALGESYKAKALANACAEEALEKIRESTSFSGSNGLPLEGGVCAYTVTNNGGSMRTINASGTANAFVRKIKIVINAINPKIDIASWQEVADF